MLASPPRNQATFLKINFFINIHVNVLTPSIGFAFFHPRSTTAHLKQLFQLFKSQTSHRWTIQDTVRSKMDFTAEPEAEFYEVLEQILNSKVPVLFPSFICKLVFCTSVYMTANVH